MADEHTNGKAKHPPRLHFGRLQAVNHARRELSADIPAGTSLETILEPSYWAHHTRDIQAGDVVEALCEDGRWEASLRVMFVATDAVRLVVRWKAEYQDAGAVVESETYEVKWINIGKKYGVMRRDDRTVIKDGFRTADMAHGFLKTHLAELRT